MSTPICPRFRLITGNRTVVSIMTRAKRVSAREGEWLRNGVFQQNRPVPVVQATNITCSCPTATYDPKEPFELRVGIPGKFQIAALDRWKGIDST